MTPPTGLCEIPPLRDMRGVPPSERDTVAAALYASIGPRVMRFGLRYFGGDAEQAEELAAETFARVIVALPHFEGRSAWATWILRIAMNVVAGWLRRRYRHTHDREADDRLAANDPTQSTKLQREDIARVVRECIATLQPDHRMVLSLLALDGLTPPEAAELLGVADGTIWSRYARARLALAEKLRARGFGPQDMPA